MSHELMPCLEAISIEENFFESIYPWKYSKSCILSLFFACKMVSSGNCTKKWITWNETRHPTIFDNILYHSTVLIICINKNFHFRSPLNKNPHSRGWNWERFLYNRLHVFRIPQNLQDFFTSRSEFFSGAKDYQS